MEAATRRRSRKRDAILEYLRSSSAHPSAETIYEQLKPQHPDLSLGTVYRNLALFRQEGTVISVATFHGSERLDARTDPHAHFLCQDCGALIDVDVPCQALGAELEERYGLEIRRSELLFRGLCPRCRERAEIRPDPDVEKEPENRLF